MKPGRELDALVAEKVMGATCVWVYDGSPFPRPRHEQVDPDVPRYSTDTAAAKAVAEKIVERFDLGGWRLEQIPVPDPHFYVEFRKGVGASAATLEAAICLAALKAVGTN